MLDLSSFSIQAAAIEVLPQKNHQSEQCAACHSQHSLCGLQLLQQFGIHLNTDRFTLLQEMTQVVQ
jgi:hypothetical protein